MVVLIPERTVERLCAYRRIIRRWVMQGRQFIQSQELADEADVTSAQVRRDFMSLNTIGIPKKGYATAALLQELGLIIEGEGGQRIVLLGAGNLGSAIVKYLDGMRPDLTIVAAFDTDPAKFGTQVDGVPCLPLTELPVVVRDRNVLMAIIAVPADAAQEMVWLVARAGIRAVVNFTSVRLKAPANVFVQDVDLSILIEKSAYYGRVMAGMVDAPAIPEPEKRVLVVSADPAAAELLDEAVRQLGGQCLVVSGHPDEDEHLRAYRPDVVVIEAASGDAAALAVARRLRADEILRRTPVLLLAPAELDAAEEPGPAAEAIGLLVDTRIEPTADPAQLVAALGRLLGLTAMEADGQWGWSPPSTAPATSLHD